MNDRSHLPPNPPFEAFYKALNNREPFPWQARLAAQVVESGEWPREVGIPTGLGKTACLDIAVWWLASQAGRSPEERTAPTRIWWLVNRRILVDSTHDHAEAMRGALLDRTDRGSEGCTQEVLSAVGTRLKSLSCDPEAAPLEVIRLRGGVASRRPTDPSRPAILMSTIPMYGSRLLFRGYGSSRLMRSVDAALAGTDSLLLVDEAHLARHLRDLVPSVSESIPGARPVLNPTRSQPRVVSLTATGDASGSERFDLADEDQRHHIVRQRLDAAKPLEVRQLRGDPSLRLAEVCQGLLRKSDRSAACLVFANTPKTARRAFDRLRKAFSRSSAEILLLTGRMREREGADVRRRILDASQGMAANRDPELARERHLIVVATQTLEVGADLDAEYLVTEGCGVRALIQRLGRLNRLGRFPHARAAYVHVVPPRRGGLKAKDRPWWPVYGREPEAVLERLVDAAEAGLVDLAPRRVSRVLGAPADEPGRAPQVLPGLLWEWVKTTTPPPGEAPVEPYFSGISRPDYRALLIWRCHLPAVGDRLWPRATEREAVDIPVSEVREVLGQSDEKVRRLGPDGIKVEEIAVEQVRPGDTVVLPSDGGLYDEFGWNPDATSPVVDMSIAQHGLPLQREAIKRLLGISMGTEVETSFGVVSLGELIKKVGGEIEDHEELDAAEQRECTDRLCHRLLQLSGDGRPPGWRKSEWKRAVEGLERRVVTALKEVPRLPAQPCTRREVRTDELDERCLTQTATELEPHGKAVGARSRSICTSLGVPTHLERIVSRAGRWHDVGKADRRFQRWLDPRGVRSVPLAKSGAPRHQWEMMRRAAGWPSKGRHEDLSTRLASRWTASQVGMDPLLGDLLLHLIISHHGHGRPLVIPARDGTIKTVRAKLDGAHLDVPADLAAIDWDQPARFLRLHEHFGPWGLALLESIVRMSDHSVSSGTQVHELEGA